MDLCRLAGPGGGFGPQTLDLAPRQGDADLPDPLQLHPVDRLGVEAREVDQGGGFSPLAGFLVTLAGLQPARGLFPVEARQVLALLPKSDKSVATLGLWPHG